MLGCHQKIFELGKRVANGVTAIMRRGPPRQRDFLDCTLTKARCVCRSRQSLLAQIQFAACVAVFYEVEISRNHISDRRRLMVHSLLLFDVLRRSIVFKILWSYVKDMWFCGFI